MSRFDTVAALAAATLPADGRIVSVKGAGDYKVEAAGATGVTLANGNVAAPQNSGTAQNVAQFGAALDGVTNNDAEITDVEAADKSVYYVPEGTALTTLGASTLRKRYEGAGQIETTEGKRGRYFSAVASRPSPLGNNGSVNTAFDGDLANVPFPVEHRITGSATLSQPTTGYVYTPEAYPHFTYLFNSSGHNQETAGNDGRTAAVAYRTNVFHSGDGDGVAYNASVFVSGSKSGATHWLASPAGVIQNGTVTAGAANVYLNLTEFAAISNGLDCSAVGAVYKLDRDVPRAGLENYWAGARVQSRGVEAIDDGYVITGACTRGLNTVRMDSASEAAVVTARDQRIYLDGAASGGSNFDTAVGDTYLTYNGSNIILRAAGHNVLTLAQTTGTNTTVDSRLSATGNINTNTQYQVGFTRVVSSRQTGWAASTGSGLKTGFATATATTEQVAQTVKALIDDLIAHGLIGA